MPINLLVPGFVELAVIVAILVVVFGARHIPALGEAIARALYKQQPDAPSEAQGTNPSAPTGPDNGTD